MPCGTSSLPCVLKMLILVTTVFSIPCKLSLLLELRREFYATVSKEHLMAMHKRNLRTFTVLES